MSIFASEFNDEEMGKITGIEVKNREIVLTEKNLNDYIDILTRKNSCPETVLSDDDLINIIKAKKRK